MEKRKKMPKSIRKFVRTEKARIRRQFFDTKKQESEIVQLYKRLANDPTAEKVKEAVAVKAAPKAKVQKAKKEKKVKVKK